MTGEIIKIKDKVVDYFKKPNEVTSARLTACQLFKSGRITDTEFDTIISGLEKVIVNVQTLQIDNSVEVSSGGKILNGGDDNSLDITQSEINGINSSEWKQLLTRSSRD